MSTPIDGGSGRAVAHAAAGARDAWARAGSAARAQAGAAGRAVYRHRRSLAVLLPVLAAIAALQAVNVAGFPQRTAEEGGYVAHAYALLHFGGMAHPAQWYDQPPLGRLQFAAYAALTGGFDHPAGMVIAGRGFMVLAHLASCVLLWILARRTEMARWAAAGALLLFTASPLAVEYHRLAAPDNIATPWVLAAFVLACTPRPRLAPFLASGAAFTVAVLSKESALLLLPVLVWLIWRNEHPGDRGHTLALVGSMLVYAWLAYAVFALVRGELFPAPGQASLWDGAVNGLLGRGSGSVPSPGNTAAGAIGAWLRLDPMLPLLGAAGAATGVFSRRFRPYAAGLLVLMLAALLIGELPAAYVLAMLPLVALTAAGAAEIALRRSRRVQPAWRPSANRSTLFGFTAVRLLPLRTVRRYPLVPVLVAAALLLAVLAAPTWAASLRGSLSADADRPMRAAADWIRRNAAPTDRVAVDPAMGMDLRDHLGAARVNVIAFASFGGRTEVIAQVPDRWHRHDLIVETSAVRRAAARLPQVGDALRGAHPIARFGTGDDRVVVREAPPVADER
ncbi:4-amino-4-deoxy-L-arabinose transferase-like glycosyltransferase [Murinocardiopsis flavida]|uniref:4-amino-4-deoxy-L-arabinose transferase-like glycosyltransferase n=1 Tax=Murinocardiopsis flavida TaxID=645275 RepID=A0A2P8DFE7_9ACTN|nr:glycosyltransferase family 39 protein [Murinocardiopsis flavida]PSK95939.1 4-amino-4-deoxy-L-arabinose transferase-like glycosyltransferase [Murinocardiopsis flavida]